MPKLIAVTALAMGTIFLAAQTAPASAQVMKNFSWKKKQTSAKAKPAERRKNAVTAPQSPSPGAHEPPKSTTSPSR